MRWFMQRFGNPIFSDGIFTIFQGKCVSKSPRAYIHGNTLIYHRSTTWFFSGNGTDVVKRVKKISSNDVFFRFSRGFSCWFVRTCWVFFLANNLFKIHVKIHQVFIATYRFDWTHPWEQIIWSDDYSVYFLIFVWKSFRNASISDYRQAAKEFACNLSCSSSIQLVRCKTSWIFYGKVALRRNEHVNTAQNKLW